MGIPVINGTLRMTSDRILLKPLEWSGEDVHGEGSRLLVVRHGRPLRGVVVAIGRGHHPVSKRTDLGNGKRRIEYSKRFRPTEVKPGDVVEIGGLNAFDGLGYQHTEVLYNGEKHIICAERDVAIVITDARAA